MGGGRNRPGRPWGPPRGSCAEINQLVELVRSWIDESSVPVSQLHQRLTPDHFVARAVPELRRLRDLLAGDGLEWDVVEAVADVCFPDDSSDRCKPRLEAARALWDRAQNSPTPLAGAQELALARELLAAKDRTIEIYQEMQRLQTAYEASERGRYQALQIATLLFAMLGQAQAKVTELKRRADALRSLSVRRPEENTPLERRLSRAQRQQEELSEQLLRAEQERDIAQQVADHAARRIQVLEGELAELRFRMADDDLTPSGSPPPQLPRRRLGGADPDDAALEDVDRALEKVRAVLDEEHAAVQRAADDVGYRASSDRMPPDVGASRTRTIAGRIEGVSELQVPSGPEQSQSAAGVVRDNPEQLVAFDGVTVPVQSDDPMRFDLRERIRVQGKLPNLPRGWHREMALRPAPGRSFSGDFVVGARTNSGRRLEVVLTDVSGKGAEAGSRALLLSGAFDGLLGSLPPAKFLPAANSYLLRQDWDEGFATSIHLALDLVSGDYELFSAGHLPGLQYGAGRDRWEEKAADGPLLGVYDGAQFNPAQGSLRPGDVLMLYTNGLVETPGRDIVEGIDRLTGEADRYMADNGIHGASWHLIEAAAEDVSDDRAHLLISRVGE